MNIKIANRLVELRKKNGLSQEELASKLGISRQAVSKWERAEASPDTDNLICLAKLYGVSLDDLLNSDESIEDIAFDQRLNSKDKDDVDKDDDDDDDDDDDEDDEDDEDKVHIGVDGIHVSSKNGDEVHIDKAGIHIASKNEHVHIGKDNYKDYVFKKGKLAAIEQVLFPIISLIAVIAYILMGTLIKNGRGWAVGWIVFVFIPVIPSILRAIRKKRFCEFNFPVLITTIFLLLGMLYSLWHPMWVLFLLIPIYYSIFGLIDKNHKEKSIDNNDEIVIDVNQ